MRPAQRQFLLRLHLGLGLPAGLVLLVVALSGTLLVFEADLDRALHPEAWHRDAAAPALPLDRLLAHARAVEPTAALREVRLTVGAPTEFRFHLGAHVRLDPATGRVLGTRSRRDSFFGTVERLHTSLVLGPAGRWVVLASTGALVVLLATGLVLAWPRQWRQLRAALTPAWHRRGRAFHFTLHQTFGFWASLPLIVLAASGLVLGFRPLGEALRGLGAGPRPAAVVPVSPATLPPASLDALAAAASAALPGWRQLRLHAPRARDDGSDDREGAEVWRAEAVAAASAHEHARSRVHLDPRTAGVLRRERFEDLPLGARLRALARPLHDGSLFGRGSQVVAFLAALTLPVLALTGTALWWLRRRRTAPAAAPARTGPRTLSSPSPLPTP